MKKTDIFYSDMHMHGSYSDGRGSLREFIKSAVEKGFSTIGFSDHSPVPLDNCWSMKLSDLNSYIDEISSLKKEYHGRIEVLLGVELDYINGVDVKEYINYESRGFDYFISSVHYVYSKRLGRYFEVDGPADLFNILLEKGFDNDIGLLIQNYYDDVRKMIKDYKPAVIGHLDLIKKNNGTERYFKEESSLYVEEVDKTLEVIKEYGALIEINTGAISRGYTKTPYPSLYILKKCLENGIGITLNSDAHEPSNIGYKFKDIIDMARTIGFAEIYFYSNGEWRPFSL